MISLLRWDRSLLCSPHRARATPAGDIDARAGEDRSRAALVSIFRNIDDEQAYDLAISENQARDALTDIERATICLNLQKQGRTVDQIAKAMGWKGESNVLRHLRIAREAPPILRIALQARRIHFHAAIVFIDEGLRLSEDQQRDALSIFTEQEPCQFLALEVRT